MCAEELDFVEKYDLLGCIQCGRCTGGCPVTLRTDLNVRCFVYDTLNDERLEELSEKPEIWDCTTCNTCAIRCPKGLEPFEVLIGLRSHAGRGGQHRAHRARRPGVHVQQRQPLGQAARQAPGLGLHDLEVRDPGAGGGEDRRRAPPHLLHRLPTTPGSCRWPRHWSRCCSAAGVDFGLIGEEEKHCGSEVRRLGEEGLFEYFDEENIELFELLQRQPPRDHLPPLLQHLQERIPRTSRCRSCTTPSSSPSCSRTASWSSPRRSPRSSSTTRASWARRTIVFDEPRYILTRIPGVEFNGVRPLPRAQPLLRGRRRQDVGGVRVQGAAARRDQDRGRPGPGRADQSPWPVLSAC